MQRPRNISITRYLEPEDGSFEIEYEVNTTVYPGRQAKINAPIEDCYPAEPPSVDILSINLYNQEHDKLILSWDEFKIVLHLLAKTNKTFIEDYDGLLDKIEEQALIEAVPY